MLPKCVYIEFAFQEISAVSSTAFFFRALYLLIFFSLLFIIKVISACFLFIVVHGVGCLGNIMNRYLVIALERLGESLRLIVSGGFLSPVLF